MVRNKKRGACRARAGAKKAGAARAQQAKVGVMS
jgi:hypothetical protein